MNEAKSVICQFKEWDDRLKVFDLAPVLKGNRYYFGDHSTHDNDVLIKNVKVGNFAASGYYVATGLQFVGGTSLDLTAQFINTIGVQQNILTSSSGAVKSTNSSKV